MEYPWPERTGEVPAPGCSPDRLYRGTGHSTLTHDIFDLGFLSGRAPPELDSCRTRGRFHRCTVWTGRFTQRGASKDDISELDCHFLTNSVRNVGLATTVEWHRAGQTWWTLASEAVEDPVDCALRDSSGRGVLDPLHRKQPAYAIAAVIQHAGAIGERIGSAGLDPCLQW